MKLFTVQLFVIATSLSAFALHIRSEQAPPALVSACPSALQESTSIINVNGQDVVNKVFSCPDGNFTTPALHEISTLPSSIFDKRSELAERGAAECTTPASECQCGASVICGCYGDVAEPVAADCTALIGSLPVIASISGATFIIQPQTAHTTTLRTCSVSFINLGTGPQEYCWDDLGGLADGEMSCMNSPSFSDAVCMAATQRFAVHLGVTAA